jgi:hypothetical protein
MARSCVQYKNFNVRRNSRGLGLAEWADNCLTISRLDCRRCRSCMKRRGITRTPLNQRRLSGVGDFRRE